MANACFARPVGRNVDRSGSVTHPTAEAVEFSFWPTTAPINSHPMRNLPATYPQPLRNLSATYPYHQTQPVLVPKYHVAFTWVPSLHCTKAIRGCQYGPLHRVVSSTEGRPQRTSTPRPGLAGSLEIGSLETRAIQIPSYRHCMDPCR